MRLTLREGLLCLIGLIVTASVASWGIEQHDARVANDALFKKKSRDMAIRTAFLEARVSDAQLHVAASAETVTVKRIEYKKLRDTIMLKPVTMDDTVKAVKQLPVIVRLADNALYADSVHQAAATKLQAESDSLIEALRDERDLWKKAKVYKPPRVTSSVAALYDPFAHVPAASAEGNVRVTERWSVFTRVDERFATGEKPRAYLAARLTF